MKAQPILLINSSKSGNTSTPHNAAFYTTDGMLFLLRVGNTEYKAPLHENPDINLCTRTVSGSATMPGSTEEGGCGGCGSFGLNNNQDGTTKPPCLMAVDVNGDRKPNPSNINCKSRDCAKPYKLSDISGSKLTDIFSVMITDKEAIPYGVAAQRAMYNSQK